MSRKNGHTQELADEASAKTPSEVRILFNQAGGGGELGTTGLKADYGYVHEAYNPSLYWPGVSKDFDRLRTSCPEMVMIGRAFTAWARSSAAIVDLPDSASDADKKYADFVLSDFDNMAGGFGEFIETCVGRVPFDGWFWWDAPPSIRDPKWKPPGGDEWESEADDGLIGIRRLAPRDTSSFYQWDLDQYKRLRGMYQWDFPSPKTYLPLKHSLHMTFGDPHNPEGSSPLQAVWRLERIRYGLELIQGMGFEHAAGYFNVTKTAGGVLSETDKRNIQEAALHVMTAQEGNFAYIPFGFEGEIKDVTFQAAPALLDAIKNYSTLMLAVFMMQTIALNTLTGTGAMASQVDTTQLAVFTFNAMLDGLAQQYDDQIGKRLWKWNKESFDGVTVRPRIKFRHVTQSVALAALGSFLQTIDGVLPLDEKDYKAIRLQSGFLPENNPSIAVNNPDAVAPRGSIGAARPDGQGGREPMQPKQAAVADGMAQGPEKIIAELRQVMADASAADRDVRRDALILELVRTITAPAPQALPQVLVEPVDEDRIVARIKSLLDTSAASAARENMGFFSRMFSAFRPETPKPQPDVSEDRLVKRISGMLGDLVKAQPAPQERVIQVQMPPADNKAIEQVLAMHKDVLEIVAKVSGERNTTAPAEIKNLADQISRLVQLQQNPRQEDMNITLHSGNDERVLTELIAEFRQALANMPAPVVNVNVDPTPIQNTVASPEVKVNVEPSIVTMEAPQVKVDVQPTPIKNEVRVPRIKKQTQRVKRDAAQNIESTETTTEYEE